MLRFQLRFVFMTNRFDTPVYAVIRNAVIKPEKFVDSTKHTKQNKDEKVC